MTAQQLDQLTMTHEKFRLIAEQGDQLPTPKYFGIVVIPGTWHTANIRGYLAYYEVTDEHLHVTRLYIGGMLLPDTEWLKINNVESVVVRH